MSRPSHWTIVWRNLKKSFGVGGSPIRTVVGKDDLGNVYYEEINSEKRKPTRGFLPGKSTDWREIPPEWHSWIRYQRRFPPVDDEVRINTMKRIKAIDSAKNEQSHIEHSRVPNISDSTIKQDGSSKQQEYPSYKEYEDLAGAKWDRDDDPRKLKKEKDS